MGGDEKSEEPDFSSFADWHVAKQEEEWPENWESGDLTYDQKRIVDKNATLLLDKDEWHKHVASFEAELAKISDEKDRKNRHSEFNVHFDEYDFSQENKDFSNYIFPCSISFRKVQFGNGRSCFDNARFECVSLIFDSASFRDGLISFIKTQFTTVYISFHRTHFTKGTLSFAKSKFMTGLISFEYAQFGQTDIIFINTKFNQATVHFDNAQLGRGFATFFKTQFIKGKVSFIDTKFEEKELIFDEAAFKETDIVFWNNIINKTFYMRYVTLTKELTFHNLTFKAPAFFSGCQFKDLPDFRNTIFERPIEISNIEIPPAEMNSHWLSPKAVNKEDVHKYRKLKSMAQDTHDHIMEGYFFAQEMRAKRGVEITSFGELLLNQLYYVFSNYGQSYWRPLIGLFSSFYLFSIIYKLIMFPHLKGFDAGLVALDYSLRHTLPFIGSLLRFSPRPDNHQSWFLERLGGIGKQGIALEVMAYIGLFQSILGLILLFLLALGLRNAFRMK